MPSYVSCSRTGLRSVAISGNRKVSRKNGRLCDVRAFRLVPELRRYGTVEGTCVKLRLALKKVQVPRILST